MNYIIADLEATCWETRAEIRRMEIIEFGAVKLDDDFQQVDEFSAFVRPAAEPVLSDFCRNLTTIRQEDVDSAKDFNTVFSAFLEWIGTEPYKLCTWSTYDLKQIRADCERHGRPFPEPLDRHIDLQQLFAAKLEIAPCTMDRALEMLDIPLSGTHHRAIDDSRNIAKIAVDLFTKRKGGGVHVVDYDPSWPRGFEEERGAILAVLKDEIAAVEHVGSTALPGVAAKPTIDLMVGVETLDVGDRIVKTLEGLGYRYFGEFSIPGRHFFRKGDPPTHHVHWVAVGCDFWEKQLLFRDYMRSHPEDASAYERLKKDLAKKYRDDRDKYTLAKTEFIEGVNRKARDWKEGGD